MSPPVSRTVAPFYFTGSTGTNTCPPGKMVLLDSDAVREETTEANLIYFG